MNAPIRHHRGTAFEAERLRRGAGFTLVELLVVLVIIAILTAIGIANLNQAQRRSRQAQCAANLKAIGAALVHYRLDMGAYPLADGVAGPQESQDRTEFGNGPAANGYWSGIPNALVRLHYLNDRNVLFCPSMWVQYPDKRERLRYAYNAAAFDAMGFQGGANPLDGVGATGEKVWICRCLHLNLKLTAPGRYLPFPHGPYPDPPNDKWGSENVLWSDMSVALEEGAKPY